MLDFYGRASIRDGFTTVMFNAAKILSLLRLLEEHHTALALWSPSRIELKAVPWEIHLHLTKI